VCLDRRLSKCGGGVGGRSNVRPRRIGYISPVTAQRTERLCRLTRATATRPPLRSPRASRPRAPRPRRDSPVSSYVALSGTPHFPVLGLNI